MHPKLELPPKDYLDRDVYELVLRRLKGSTAAFGARDAELMKVQRAAEGYSYTQSVESKEVSIRGGTDQSYLQVRFFGHFQLYCGNEAVSLGCHGKTLAIAKYLLANRGRPVSRDYLMGWLWPESSPRKARSSLNSAICILRKILSDLPPLAAVPECILLEKGHYHLYPNARVKIDVEKFDASYERGLRLEEAGLMSEASAQYEAAIGLYQGDYLEEDLYEAWTMIRREQLLDAYLDMLGRLAAYYLESGQLQESRRACYRVLEKDPCHEDSHLLLTECYSLLGSYGRASLQYRLFENLLRSICNTKPSAEAEESFRRVLAT